MALKIYYIYLNSLNGEGLKSIFNFMDIGTKMDLICNNITNDRFYFLCKYISNNK